MALAPGFLDELRSRISLSGLIGRTVKLARRGREYAGLCPFHHEKTPSFYVVEDKFFFHCFGCGAHGDAIGFVMRVDNLDFIAAVEKLAGEAGLSVAQATTQERERAQHQKPLSEALMPAAAFYESRLWAPAGAGARDYLLGRGLDLETIRRFRLGWASDDRQVLRRRLAADFPEGLLTEAGLLRHPEHGEPFDYFRGRIMFPIGDRAGRIIAFGGRVLGEAEPKYLNSPEHPLFEKGRVLYGWSAARAAKTDRPDAIVTEGYMDVIALHRADFPTAVAPLGTALTEFQLHELWRLGPDPVLCFDGDAAGRSAAIRVLRRALPLLRPGQSLRFATVPSGQDPDSLLRTGVRSPLEAVSGAPGSLADTLWEFEVGAKPRDTPERLADVRSRLLAHAQSISDRMVRFEYETLFKARCDPRGLRRGTAPSAASAVGREGPPPPPRPPQRLQREILFRILLHFPEVIYEVAQELDALNMPEAELNTLRREILELTAQRPGLDAEALQQHLVKTGCAATVVGLLSPSVDTGFLARCPDPTSARREWTHVVRMLMGGDRAVVFQAGNDLERDVSAEMWERFQAAREWVVQQGLIGDDQI